MTNAEKFKTAEEREMAFDKWCKMQGRCDVCSLGEHEHCIMYWLDLEAEAAKPLPCPFCGCTTTERYRFGIFIQCDSPNCQYMSGVFKDNHSAIAAHNRVARAVMEAGKKEEIKE